MRERSVEGVFKRERFVAVQREKSLTLTVNHRLLLKLTRVFFFFFTKLIVTKAKILLNIIHSTTYFENLIVKLHVLYVINTNIKFCVNWILFTI